MHFHRKIASMKDCNIQAFDHKPIDEHIISVMNNYTFNHDDFISVKFQRQTTLFNNYDVFYWTKIKINEPSVISADIIEN